MPSTSKKSFVVLSVIEAGSTDADGNRELRKEPGDTVTADELYEVGQSDEDIEYLVAGGTLEAA